MGPTAKPCFPACERVVKVGKRKQELSLPPIEEQLLFLFSNEQHKADGHSGFKQRAQRHMNVKVFLRLHVIPLLLFIQNFIIFTSVLGAYSADRGISVKVVLF